MASAVNAITVKLDFYAGNQVVVDYVATHEVCVVEQFRKSLSFVHLFKCD